MLHISPPNYFQSSFSVVGTICLYKGRMLLLKRSFDVEYANQWGLPAGKLEDKELPEEGALRELFEETSIKANDSLLKFIQKYYVQLPDRSFTFYLFIITLNSLPRIKINKSEHIDFVWPTFDEALTLSLVDGLKHCLWDQRDLISPIVTPTIDEIEKDSQVRNKNCSKNVISRRLKWWASIGAPASGKSTTLNEFAKIIPNINIVSPTLDAKLKLLLHKAFVKNNSNSFFVFQKKMLGVSAECIGELDKMTLADESIYSVLSYSRALYCNGVFNAKEYDIFYKEYIKKIDQIPLPSGVLYFNCPTNTLLKRISERLKFERWRSHEKKYDVKYISLLQEMFGRTATRLSSSFHVVSIDTSLTDAKVLANDFRYIFDINKD